LVICALVSGIDLTHAQQPKFQTAPATDTSAQASPINTYGSAAKPTDNATESSPEIGPSTTARGITLAAHTALPIKLASAIDSGKLKNGDTVRATLTSAVKTSSGTTLAAGTPVAISVIATVPAGKLNAVGEFSLQAVKVGSAAVYTDTQTFRGEPGHKDLPDSAPATGTDAGLAAGAELTFHVQKPPTAADGPPKQTVATPGSVNGRASGSAPPSSPKTSH